MTVLVLTNCPAGLRGFLTRWLQEISPGVFVGTPSARLRDVIWSEVREYAGQGRALLVHNAAGEQGYTFTTHDHAWHPIDHEGLTLIHRPPPRHPPHTSPRSGLPAGRSAGGLEQGREATALREGVRAGWGGRGPRRGVR